MRCLDDSAPLGREGWHVRWSQPLQYEDPGTSIAQISTSTYQYSTRRTVCVGRLQPWYLVLAPLLVGP
eukprot:3101370-Rhodomonas_salina.1